MLPLRHFLRRGSGRQPCPDAPRKPINAGLNFLEVAGTGGRQCGRRVGGGEIADSFS
ncbi:MAG: hypothetical protein LAN59_07330 [Acidobacteriia bacterium]|nr:hypothetical protein [Terriglobia bacterium]